MDFSKRRTTLARRAINSKNAGYTFGRLYYTFNPNLVYFQLMDITRNLHLTKAYDFVSYRLGFLEGYGTKALEAGKPVLNYESGYMSPLSTERENTSMGKLGSLQAKVQEMMPKYPFVKPAQLAELQSVFCIRGINKGNSETGGEQWYLQIMLMDDDIANLETEEPIDPDEGMAVFSLQAGKVQRDTLMEMLKENLPIHSVAIQEIQLPKGRKFYDLMEVEDFDCVCGSSDEEDEVEEDEEEEEEVEEVAPPPKKTSAKGVDFSKRVRQGTTSTKSETRKIVTKPTTTGTTRNTRRK